MFRNGGKSIKEKWKYIAENPLRYVLTAIFAFLCVWSIWSFTSHYEWHTFFTTKINFIHEELLENRLILQFVILTIALIYLTYITLMWFKNDLSRLRLTVETVGIIIGLFGIFELTSQSSKTENQLKTTSTQVQKERFSSALEQTGNENPAIRSAGLIVLETFLSEESEPFERVWKFLYEFLLFPPDLDGYVSLSEQQNLERELKQIEDINERKKRQRELEDKYKSKQRKFVLRGRRPDIEKIVKMIREAEDNEYYDPKKFDLSGVVLQGADLSGANLSDVVLQGTDLFSANLSGTSFEDSNLSGTDLSGADLFNASLHDANLNGANLSSANLGHANLSETTLIQSNLSGANLGYANLSSTNLSFSDLSKSKLFGVILFEAELLGVNIYQVELYDAGRNLALKAGAVEINPREWKKFRDDVPNSVYEKIFHVGKHLEFVEEFKTSVEEGKDIPAFVDRFLQDNNIQ